MSDVEMPVVIEVGDEVEPAPEEGENPEVEPVEPVEVVEDPEASGERIDDQDITAEKTDELEAQLSGEKISGSAKDEEEAEVVYGGCDGPNAAYVMLVSCDNHSFIIKREMVLVSGTIKAMLSGPGQFAEGEANIVNLREIPSHLLERVCQYFQYKVFYTQFPQEIPKFPIEPTIALELLMAANFLDC